MGELTTEARSKVLPAVFTVAAVTLIVGLFGHALADFAYEREKTGTSSRIVLAVISAMPDRDGDVRFTATSPAEAAVDNKPIAEVEKIQRQWASLWSQRNAEAFLKLYDPSFPDFDRYAETRAKRMSAAKEIVVDVKDLTVTAAGPGMMVARFTQHYRSDAYQDSVTKEVVWKSGPQGYRIVAEKTVK